MLCHSVSSCLLPVLSRQRRLVARVKLATGCPDGVDRTSGSRPRLPIRMTLLTMRRFSSAFESGTLSHRTGGKISERTIGVRLVIQRVGAASVRVDGEVVGEIGRGLLVLAGIERG